MLWEPGNFHDDGAKRVGMRFASNTDLELWTEEVEQGVIDNMIVCQNTELVAHRAFWAAVRVIRCGGQCMQQ